MGSKVSFRLPGNRYAYQLVTSVITVSQLQRTGYVYPPEDDTKCSVSLHTVLPSTSDDPAVANYNGSTHGHAFSDSPAFMHTVPLISPPHSASWPVPTQRSWFSSSLTSSGNLALLGRITSSELVAPCSHLFHFTHFYCKQVSPLYEFLEEMTPATT